MNAPTGPGKPDISSSKDDGQKISANRDVIQGNIQIGDLDSSAVSLTGDAYVYRAEGNIYITQQIVDGKKRDSAVWSQKIRNYAFKQYETLVETGATYAPLTAAGKIPENETAAEPDLKILGTLRYIQSIRTRCPIQSRLATSENLALVGSGGTGKSTALRFYAWSQFAQFVNDQPPDFLPIQLRLSDIDPDTSLIDAIAFQSGFDREEIHSFISQGRLELLADGVNELPEKAAQSILEELKALAWQTAGGQNRLKVTSRKALANWRFLALPAIEIAPLNQKAAAEMIRRLAPSSSASKLLFRHMALEDPTTWYNQTAVIRLARLPLAIKMLVDLAEAAIYRAVETGQFVLPRLRGDLFSRWSNLQLQRLYSKPNKRPRFDLQHLENGLQILASHMLSTGLGTTISRQEATDILTKVEPAKAAMLLDELINATILESTGQDKLAWWHQGLRDFWAARYIDRQLRSKQPIDSLLHDRDWDDPFVFAMAMLDESDIEPFLRSTSKKYPFLAARCYTEIRHSFSLPVLEEELVQVMSQSHSSMTELSGDTDQLAEMVRRSAESQPDFLKWLLLAKLVQSLGRFEEEIQCVQRALTMPAPGIEARIDSLGHLATAYRRQGNHGQALHYLGQALATAEENNFHSRDDLTYYELGYLFEREGLSELAICCYEQSYRTAINDAQQKLESGDRQGYRRRTAHAHMAASVHLALLVRCHRFEGVFEMGNAALEAFKNAGFTLWIRNAHFHLQLAYLFRYQLHKREEDLVAARRHASLGTIGENSKEGNAGSLATQHLNDLYFSIAENRPHQAVLSATLGEEALDIAQLDDQRAQVLYLKGQAFRQLGRDDAAKRAFQKATKCNPIAHNRWGIARALRELAKMELEKGHTQQAAEAAEMAQRLFKAMQSLEESTCQPIIDRLQQTRSQREEYRRWTQQLPRLQELLPEIPASANFLERGPCQELIIRQRNKEL